MLHKLILIVLSILSSITFAMNDDFSIQFDSHLIQLSQDTLNIAQKNQINLNFDEEGIALYSNLDEFNIAANMILSENENGDRLVHIQFVDEKKVHNFVLEKAKVQSAEPCGYINYQATVEVGHFSDIEESVSIEKLSFIDRNVETSCKDLLPRYEMKFESDYRVEYLFSFF